MSDKRVLWFYDFLSTIDTNETTYLLSPQQAQALAACLPQMTWDSRWEGPLPTLDWRMEFAADIDYRLSNPMTICDVIADCITNDPGVQQALADAMLNVEVINNAVQQIINNSYAGTGYPNTPLPPSIMASNIIPQSALCTNDNKYAMARAIVQGLDKLATDFLEIIALITLKKEIAAEIVQSIPIFGGLASLALDAAVFIDDYIKTAYAAAYNGTTEVDYSCAVYCAFDNCDLTWDAVIAAYEEQASIIIPSFTSFQDVLTWLFTNIVPNTDNLIVGAMHVFILNCLKYGSDWLGSGVWTALEIAIEDAADEEITVPASCNCPSTWCYEIDFTQGSLGLWQIFAGTLTASGVESIWVSGLAEAARICIDGGTPFVWQEFEVEYQYSLAPTGASDNLVAVPCDTITGIDGNNGGSFSGNYQWVVHDPAEDTSIQTFIYSGTVSQSKRWLMFNLWRYGLNGASCYIRRIKLYGSGPTPSTITSNC